VGADTSSCFGTDIRQETGTASKKISSPEEFERLFQGLRCFWDATERRIQRFKNKRTK